MERPTGILGLADFVLSKRHNHATYLDGITAIITWKPVERLLHCGLGRGNKITDGAKSYPFIQMFKILFLQQWYGMSDQETEYAMLDRISFIRFVGLSLEDTMRT